MDMKMILFNWKLQYHCTASIREKDYLDSRGLLSGVHGVWAFFYNKVPSNRAAEEISATPEDDDYHNNVDDVKVMSILINYLGMF